jgi:hypothetical protein
MTPGRYETSNEAQRLSGVMEQRGSHSGFSTLGAFLFGSVFVAIGSGIILVGTKVIAIGNVNAPYWVVTFIGAVFAAGGLIVWKTAMRQYAANKHHKESARRHQEEPALQDYPWDQRGFTPPRWKPAVSAVVQVSLFTLFVAPFNWWAFGNEGPLLLKIVVGIFDIGVVLGIRYVIIRVGRAFKFGGSRIEFLKFPYNVSQPVELRWYPATAIARVNKGSFTLRCVSEWFEETSRGKNRRRQLVQEQAWRGTWLLEEQRVLTRHEEIDLRFDLPKHLPSTNLHGGRPVFWELEVKLDLPGLDFEERYLVPVYGKT